MSYPTTAELVDASSVDELTTLDTPQQDALRDEAIAAVENYCGQSFTQEGTTGSPVTKTLDSPGGDVLGLPRRLASLSSFAFAGTTLDGDSVALSDDHDRLVLSDPRAGGSWLLRVQAQRDAATLSFPSGPALAAVAGVWGWTDAEYDAQLDAITTALRFDMEDRALANAHKLSGTVRSARALGLSDVSQGSLSYSFADDQPSVSQRVMRIIPQELIWAPALGALA